MVEETMSSPTSQLDGKPGQSNSAQAPAERQAAVRNRTSARTAGRPIGRQQRLKHHMLIGLLMAGIAISGYAFIGPGMSAHAAVPASHRLVDVATNVSANGGESGQSYPPTQKSVIQVVDSNTEGSDLNALFAEMEEITLQMNALKAENLSANISSTATTSFSTPGLVSNGGNTSYNGTTVNDPDQLLSTLEQMMSMTHDMMAKMNNMGGPVSGTNNQESGSGHGHH